MSPILKYGIVRLLNVPHAQEMADEVLSEDCYRLQAIAPKSFVVDIGACYGEFSVTCGKMGHEVLAFEPNRTSCDILRANALMNHVDHLVGIACVAVSDVEGQKQFHEQESHPGGSSIGELGKSVVTAISINEVMLKALEFSKGRPIFVKMDCEGSEREIFRGTSWLKHINQLSMEWHNKDGHLYADLLTASGFGVELEGGGPKPRPSWEPNMSGGLIHARRIKQ